MSLDPIFSFISDRFPQIAPYALIIVVVAVVTYYVTKFYVDTKKLHKDMPVMQATLTRIDRGLATLNTLLLEKTIISQSCYSNGNSPRVANDLGQKLFEESGGTEVFERLKDGLLADLERRPLASLLEVENQSLNTLLAHRDDPQFKPLQDFAFQHPTFQDNPLTYSDILFVMSLKLRDLYRSQHPELTAD